LAEAFAKRVGYSGTSSQRRFTDKPSSFCPSLPQRLPEKRLADAVRKSGEPAEAVKKIRRSIVAFGSQLFVQARR
jgi:hypothetical protein